MYSTGQLYNEKRQTGGIKRFLELAKYLQKKENADFCSADDFHVLHENGLLQTYKIEAHKTSKFLPPEASILIANKKLLRKIKKTKYTDIISFDVPPTVGLCLAGLRNITLMIRKDLIGYEKIRQTEHRNYFKLFYLWLSEFICMVLTKKIIVQCEYDKNNLINRHPLISSYLKKKILVQINNVNPSWARNNEGSSKIDDGLFRICFIGDFNEERKGHGILLPVAKKLSKYYNVHFDIIGGGRDLEKYSKEYESERIKFWGKVDNPIQILTLANLSVVPSLADSCPNTVLEALYNHIPVIGSNVGGIPEILNNGDALFEMTEKSLYSKLEQLITNNEVLLRLAEQQKGRTDELTFNWAEQISCMLRL